VDDYSTAFLIPFGRQHDRLQAISLSNQIPPIPALQTATVKII